MTYSRFTVLLRPLSMKIKDFAPVFFEALLIFRKQKNIPPFQDNKTNFFGKKSKSDKEKKGLEIDRVESQEPLISMSDHIKMVTGAEISGSTLLQSMYNPLIDFLEGENNRKGKKGQIGIRSSTFRILQDYVEGRKSGTDTLSESDGGRILESDFPLEIDDYRDTTWFTYSYEEYTGTKTVSENRERISIVWGIGRSVLRISKSGVVTIENYTEADGRKTLNTDYKGTLSLIDRYVLEFDMFSKKNKDKHLHIRMLRNPVPIQGFAMGGYITKGIKYGLLSGSLIFELVTEDNRDISPYFFKAGSRRFKDLNKSILRYLYRRSYNYLRIPNGIASPTGLVSWLESAKAEASNYPDRYENYENDVFIAGPFSSLSPEMRLSHKIGIDKIAEAFRTHHDFKHVNTGTWGDGDPDRLWNVDAIKDTDFMTLLFKSKHFIFIYPTKVVSSALIQAGMAIGRKKPTVIFYREKSDLPQILQKANHVASLGPLRLCKFNTYDEIVRMIKDKRGPFYW